MGKHEYLGKGSLNSAFTKVSFGRKARIDFLGLSELTACLTHPQNLHCNQISSDHCDPCEGHELFLSGKLCNSRLNGFRKVLAHHACGFQNDHNKDVVLALHFSPDAKIQ